MDVGLGSDLEDLTAILVLGVGLAALFLGYDWFWMAWIFGFVVVVPLVDLLTSDGDADFTPESPADAEPGSTQDALDALRERYARGDLTEAQFERKVERLLETETPEDVADARERADAGESADAREETTEREREPERE